MAIIITILSVIGAGLLSLYKASDRQNYLDTTNQHLNSIPAAIKNFYLLNNRFPCPADPTLPPTNPKYAREATNNLTGINLRCTVMAARGHNPNPPGALNSPGHHIRIGAIPARDIGLTDDYMADAHGYLLIYAVTEALTVYPPVGAFGTLFDASGNIKNGGIDIYDGKTPALSLLAGATAPPGPCAGQSIPAAPGPGYYAAYAVISPGRDGRGFYNRNGLRPAANNCTVANTGLDFGNCRNYSVGINEHFVGGTYTCLKDQNGVWNFTYNPHGVYGEK